MTFHKPMSQTIREMDEIIQRQKSILERKEPTQDRFIKQTYRQLFLWHTEEYFEREKEKIRSLVRTPPTRDLLRE